MDAVYFIAIAVVFVFGWVVGNSAGFRRGYFEGFDNGKRLKGRLVDGQCMRVEPIDAKEKR